MIRDFKSRKISKLTGTARPSRLLFLDTETKVKRVGFSSDGKIIVSGWDEYLYKDDYKEVDIHRFDLGWTCFERYSKEKGFSEPEWILWHSSKKFCEYIQSKTISTKDLYVFGHNIFFDLQAGDFFHYFTRWGWVLDFIYDKGTTYILAIHKGDRSLRCVSTTNYFPFTLERLGEFLGLSKLKIDFNKSSRYEKVNYCRRDTEIIKHAIEYYIWFLNKHSLGKFCMARASQAYTAYRYRFMTKGIYRHKEKDIIELEAASYCGGRVECGFLGDLPEDDYVSLDVNSMYSFVMKKFKMPTKLVDCINNVFIPDLPIMLKGYAAIGDVIIDTDEPCYAVKHKGKLIFPIGSFQTALCTGSLFKAYKKGHLRAITRLLLYRKDFIFSEYVSFFTALKQKYSKENNRMLREIAKDFLNHLYGKFAQQKDIIEVFEDITFNGYSREITGDLVTGNTEIITKLFNKRIVTFGREPSSSYFVSIASHITDYARLHLYKLMQAVGLDKVLYVDTDSLKIRKKDIDKLAAYIHPYRLGALKIEDEFRKFSIYGAKYYITEKRKKIKGVPLKAEYLGDYKYKYTEFLKQTTHLRAEVTRFFITNPIIKKVSPYYDKGKVLKGGKVVPFTFFSD